MEKQNSPISFHYVNKTCTSGTNAIANNDDEDATSCPQVYLH